MYGFLLYWTTFGARIEHFLSASTSSSYRVHHETTPGPPFADHVPFAGAGGCGACFLFRRPQLEGMEGLIDQFHSIVKDFRLKRHDLLAYHNNKFDRDYVEFNVKISDLECSLQASLLARFLWFL